MRHIHLKRIIVTVLEQELLATNLPLTLFDKDGLLMPPFNKGGLGGIF